MSKFNLNSMLNCTSNQAVVSQVTNMPIKRLNPYHNHMFSLYDGERLEDMKESIRKNGIIQPLIVQPINDGEEYEILVGHNRAKCAGELGIESVPCIIKQNLSEEEAEAYVIESNVIQRGFDNLKITEQAMVINNRYSSMFSQGKRNDIISELSSFEIITRRTNRDELADEYKIGARSVARLLRVAKIENKEAKERIDDGRISIRTAVELSYLSKDQLNSVLKATQKHGKITETKARKLRRMFDDHHLSVDEIKQELSPAKREERSKTIAIPPEIVEMYFKDNNDKVMRDDIIIEMIRNALRIYDRR